MGWWGVLRRRRKGVIVVNSMMVVRHALGEAPGEALGEAYGETPGCSGVGGLGWRLGAMCVLLDAMDGRAGLWEWAVVAAAMLASML